MSIQQALHKYLVAKTSSSNTKGKPVKISKIIQKKSGRTIYQHKGWSTQFVETQYFRFDLTAAVNDIIKEQSMAYDEVPLKNLLDYFGWSEADKPHLKKYFIQISEELWTTLRYLPSSLLLIEALLWAKQSDDTTDVDKVVAIVDKLDDDEIGLLQMIAERTIEARDMTLSVIGETIEHMDVAKVAQRLVAKKCIEIQDDRVVLAS